MKYKCYRKVGKAQKQGGDYWRNANFEEHLKLTSYQTSYQYLLKNYPSPQKILEAGCGIGRWVIPLSKEKYEVTGIEIEKEALDTIKQNYSADNLTLVHGDIFNMSFPDKSFDIILSLGVLEHFENQSIQKDAVLEHVRVLSDTGVFIITVPHLSILRLFFHIPYVFLITLVRKIKGKDQYFTEYRYSKNSFKKVLKKCNLKIIDIIYDDFKVPYSFGLTVDYPINIFFRSNQEDYMLNKIGKRIFRLLWCIHPKLVSGGIGFITQKM